MRPNRLTGGLLLALAVALATVGCQQEAAATETKSQEASVALSPEKQQIMDEQMKNWDPKADKK